MMAAAALLVLSPAGAASDPAVPAYPATAVLAAFREACGDLRSLAVATSEVRAHGWQAMADDAPSPLMPIIAFGKAAAARDPEVRLLPGAAFQRTVAGRKLYLALSGVRYGQTEARGCRLYDFAASAPLEPAAVATWIGRQPDSVESPLAGVTRSAWAPGIAPHQNEFEAVHVAAGTQLPLDVHLAGLVLTAEAMETRKQ